MLHHTAQCILALPLLAGGYAPDLRTIADIPPPAGATRVSVSTGSFDSYLRRMELRPPGTPVMLHNGLPKGRQDVHAAVVDLTLGGRDLQQCADAIMRLRAEYLFTEGRMDEIAFDLTNGTRVPWLRWRQGDRVKVDGNRCSWTTGGPVDASYAQLLRYLDFVFTYAGTLSLQRELLPGDGRPVQAGDVFIQGGSPGHAVLVLDVAIRPDGRTFLLLGQGYMPAQDFHVLKGPVDGHWYEVGNGPSMPTPEWTFRWSDRYKWP